MNMDLKARASYGDSAGQPLAVVHILTVPVSLGFLRGKPAFLRSKGFTFHAITSPGKELTSFGDTEGAIVHAVPMERRITPLKDLWALWQMYRILRRIRPHIVHAHTPKGGLLGMLAAWLAGVPVRIHTIHGLPMATAKGLKRLLLKWSEKVACWCAHRVLSVSGSIRDEAIGEGLCPPEKIQVPGHGSSNGVDAVERFHPRRHADQRRMVRRQHEIPEDALVVGFVGRIVRDKGMIELAGAWRMLRERFPTLHLMLVGTFEPQDPVPAEVENLFRTDPRIHCVGWVRQTAPYYAAMDVCTLPTYREGLPGVLLEAAAMEVPVVATAVSGCVDAVENGVTGLLVPPCDAEALAEVIAEYLRRPAFRRQHGEAGRARVLRDFRPEVVQQEIYEQYVGLLEERGLPLPVPVSDETSATEGRRAA